MIDTVLNLLKSYNIQVLFSGIIIYNLNNYFFSKLLSKRNNLFLLFLFNGLKVFIVMTVIVLLLFQVDKFDKIFTSLLTNSALLIAVLGFILQNSIKNVLSGIMLISSEAFKVGDRIRIQDKDITGFIEDFTLRHTTIKLHTNERAVIPNSLLNDCIVISNDLREKETSYPLILYIPINTDIYKAKEIILESINNIKEILNLDEINITVSNIDTHFIELKTIILTKDIASSFNILSDLRTEIVSKLNKLDYYEDLIYIKNKLTIN